MGKGAAPSHLPLRSERLTCSTGLYRCCFGSECTAFRLCVQRKCVSTCRGPDDQWLHLLYTDVNHKSPHGLAVTRQNDEF